MGRDRREVGWRNRTTGTTTAAVVGGYRRFDRPVPDRLDLKRPLERFVTLTEKLLGYAGEGTNLLERPRALSHPTRNEHACRNDGILSLAFQNTFFRRSLEQLLSRIGNVLAELDLVAQMGDLLVSCREGLFGPGRCFRGRSLKLPRDSRVAVAERDGRLERFGSIERVRSRSNSRRVITFIVGKRLVKIQGRNRKEKGQSGRGEGKRD